MADDEIVINIGRSLARISKITIKFDHDDDVESSDGTCLSSIPYDSLPDDSSRGRSRTYRSMSSSSHSPRSSSSSSSSSSSGSEIESEITIPREVCCYTCGKRVGQFIYSVQDAITEITPFGVCVDTKTKCDKPYVVINIRTQRQASRYYNESFAICSEECLDRDIVRKILLMVCDPDVKRAGLMMVDCFEDCTPKVHISNGWANGCNSIYCTILNEDIITEKKLKIDIAKLTSLIEERGATVSNFRKKLSALSIHEIVEELMT